MNTCIVKFRLLGPLALEFGDKLITEEDIRSQKLLQLLTYFIVHRNRCLPTQELIEAFCDLDGKGPADTLKNLVYRLRSVLKGLGDENFIITTVGHYQWNSDIIVETDYEKFGKLFGEAENCNENNIRKIKYREALAVFAGDISGKVRLDALMPFLNALMTQKRNALYLLCEAEKKDKNWEEIRRICETLLGKDCLDEKAHLYILSGYCCEQRYEDGIHYYEQIRAVFFEHGVEEVPASLTECYQKILTEAGKKLKDMDALLDEAKEADTPQGAYYCTYDSFCQIYQVEVRKYLRSNLPEDMAAHVLLFSLMQVTRQGNEQLDQENMDEAMDSLRKTIQNSLRVGDIYSKCTESQYIVLLCPCTVANAEMIANRIRKNYRRVMQKKAFQLTYEVDSVKNDINMIQGSKFHNTIRS